MKVNIVAVRLWIYTIGFILFSFLATTLFYGLFYSQQVEDMYLDDFNQVMKNVETLSTRDPHFLVENIEEYDLIDSKVYFSIDSGTVDSADGGQTFAGFPSYVRTQLPKEEAMQEVLSSNEENVIRSTLQMDGRSGVPFIFRVHPFELNEEPYVLYSYADVAFLNKIESRTNTILGWLIVVYLFLSVLYYIYLKKNISDPIHEMTDTAFSYAKNDFSKELPVHGRDDLAQLAMAMNKMGNALETSATAISQEKDLLSNIMNSIDTGVLYFDKDRTLLLSNPAGEQFLQEYRFQEENAPIDNNTDELKEKMVEASTYASTVHYAMELNDNFYSINIFPITEGNTSLIRGNIISIQDLTQEHRLDKTRVDFINNISHELRTPLVMVQGYSEAILDDVAESAEEKKEMASIIRDEAERMNRMVNEMLDLSRMEAGYIDLYKETVDIEDYFSRLVSRFRKMANEANIQLSYSIFEEIRTCYMDRDKMDQVFVNLLNNAIRHTRSDRLEDGKVSLHARLDTLVDEVILEVRDNGSGIPSEDIPYIFDRFYKADKSRENHVSNKRGTGIGLSLVKNIIEAHDGYIEVESELGKGTSFIIHIPYIEEYEEKNETTY